MTREEAKTRMLNAFLDNDIEGKSIVSFVAGFPDDFEPFDDELYDMMRELAQEGKLTLFKFAIPGREQVEMLFPPGTLVI